MKTKDQIEFIKNLISAHFDKGYRLLQVKDTNEHNAKREKQKETRRVRIVMCVLAFICLSFGIRGFFHLEEYQYFLGTNALPADAKLIASGLTVFGIIFALIGLDPQLAMKVDSSDGFVKEFSREIEPNDMLCQREISAIINRSDDKYADLLPKDYRQKAVDSFVKNI